MQSIMKTEKYTKGKMSLYDFLLIAACWRAVTYCMKATVSAADRNIFFKRQTGNVLTNMIMGQLHVGFIVSLAMLIYHYESFREILDCFFFFLSCVFS